MNIALPISGAMAALFAAMLAFDGKPLPCHVPIFRAEFNWNAYNVWETAADSSRVAETASDPYDSCMPYLVDGNNLMPALADAGPEVGREGLCRLLQPLLEHGDSAHVVFDGPVPPAGVAAQIEQTGVKVTWSLQRTADEIILKLIAQDTAPKLLTVVSTDKEIRRAAERRRCKVVTSQEFALKLVHIDTARHKPKAPRSPESRAKQKGLTDQETRRWLKEFGFDELGDGSGGKDA